MNVLRDHVQIGIWNFFLKIERYFGFHTPTTTPTTGQPKGRCVWGMGLRSRALGTCFAEKLVRRFCSADLLGLGSADVGGVFHLASWHI